jgi:hypothetical protein
VTVDRERERRKSGRVASRLVLRTENLVSDEDTTDNMARQNGHFGEADVAEALNRIGEQTIRPSAVNRNSLQDQNLNL